MGNITQSATKWWVLLLSGAAVGCSGTLALPGGAIDAGPDASCAAGDTKPCTCVSGAMGTLSCIPGTNQFATECQCAPPDMAIGPGVCGDGVCNLGFGEDCTMCPEDCGQCPKCPYAPSCTEAVGAPINPTPEANLNYPNGGPWAGDYGGDQQPMSCGPAKLRIGITKILANKNDGQSIYCIVQATDGVASGAAITNKTGGLNDGDSYSFDPSVGVFWGQKDLAVSKNNMTITYNCVQVNKDVWGAVLMAAGMAAGQAGQFGGAYGWAFGLGDVGLQAAGAALAATAGDDNLFNAQQVVDKNELLDMTNGKTWTITAGGGSCGGFIGIGTHACQYTLTVESWGCADGKPVPQ